MQILVAWSNQLTGESKRLFDRNPVQHFRKIGMPQKMIDKLMGVKK